ncbi:MAG: hypothetical protein ACRDH2_17410, partial [Anaerolineales bacterium]
MKHLERLTPRQRRRLTGLTLIFGASLITLVTVVVRAQPALPAIPGLLVFIPPTRPASVTVTLEPTAYALTYAASTQAVGAEPV